MSSIVNPLLESIQFPIRKVHKAPSPVCTAFIFAVFAPFEMLAFFENCKKKKKNALTSCC